MRPKPWLYVVRRGKGFWLPTPGMRVAGAQPKACGKDGDAARALAEECNAKWLAEWPGYYSPKEADDAYLDCASCAPVARARGAMNRAEDYLDTARAIEEFRGRRWVDTLSPADAQVVKAFQAIDDGKTSQRDMAKAVKLKLRSSKSADALRAIYNRSRAS